MRSSMGRARGHLSGCLRPKPSGPRLVPCPLGVEEKNRLRCAGSRRTRPASATLPQLGLGLIAMLAAACGTPSRLSPSVSVTTLMVGWERHFSPNWTVETEPSGARRRRGYRYNQHGEQATSARLLAQALDSAGAVLGQGLYVLPERRRQALRGRRGSLPAELRRNRAIEIGGVVVRLSPDRGPALGAHIVVLVAAWKHEQEFLAGRRRSPASRAEKTRGLELLEAVSPSHRQEFYTVLSGRATGCLLVGSHCRARVETCASRTRMRAPIGEGPPISSRAHLSHWALGGTLTHGSGHVATLG